MLVDLETGHGEIRGPTKDAMLIPNMEIRPLSEDETNIVHGGLDSGSAHSDFKYSMWVLENARTENARRATAVV